MAFRACGPGMLTPAPSGGGGGGDTPTTGIWSGLKVQNPQDALTTYFPGTTLESAWTEFDNDGRQTVTIADGTASLVTTTGTIGLFGIKAVAPPDDQFSLTAQIRMSAASINFGQMNAFIAENLVTNPTTANLFVFGPSQSSPSPFYAASRWTAYDTYGAGIPNQPSFRPHTTSFVRLFVDRTAFRVRTLWSVDGENWIQTVPEINFSITGVSTISSIGLVCDNRTGLSSLLASSMMRIDRSSDPFLPCGGYI